jgi:Flp pilus assembly pilin Flp
LWSGIKTGVSSAWDKVKDWINAKWSDMSSSWSEIKSNMSANWSTIKNKVNDAWEKFLLWKDMAWSKMSSGWEDIKDELSTKWNDIKSKVSSAWESVQDWKDAKWKDFQAGWTGVQANMGLVWSTIKNKIIGAWDNVKKWWDDNIYSKVKGVWDKIAPIFEPLKDIVGLIKIAIEAISGDHNVNIKENITRTITIIERTAETAKNTVTKGTVENEMAGVAAGLAKNSDNLLMQTAGTVFGWLTGHAEGAYGIPKGEVFVAQEAGAELVGSINGKTSVANQGQIIEGIRLGVRDANDEQNVLLRQQNELLRGILEKEFRIGASASFGKVARKSLDMYDSVIGG